MESGDPSRAHLARITQALDDVARYLGMAKITPRVRELRARLSSYERVVSGWSFRPPSASQCAAMLECVNELHALALGARHSQRPPPSWSGPPPAHAHPRVVNGGPASSPRGPVSQRITWRPGMVSRPPHARTTRPPPPSQPPGG